MFRIALKGLLGHKLRFVLTTLAVVLGVTFVAGAFVLTDTMEQAFDDLYGSLYEDTDVVVRTDDRFASGGPFGGDGGATFAAELVDELAALDGVAAAVPDVEGQVTVVGPDGEPVSAGQGPSTATAWTDAANPLTVEDGSPPGRSGELTLDERTVDRAGFALGDEVALAGPDGLATFRLVGVTGSEGADALLGATTATVTLEDAQALFDQVGQVDQIALVGDGSVDAPALRDRVEEVLVDRGVEADVTTADDLAAQESDDVGDALGFLTTVLLAFAGIALFVGAFLIANTFAIIVAQRSREFALLRAVGASRVQVRTAVLLEALAVGLLAATIGLLLGIGFATVLPTLLEVAGITLPTGDPVIAPRTVVAAYAIGVLVTLLSSVLPARRASRVAPVEAMRGAATAPTAPLTRRSVVGAVLAALGGVLLVLGLAGDLPEPLAVVGLGAALAFVGVALLAPLLADPLARTIGALPARASVSGRIARGNAGRDPRRTASTASALMIGLALVSAVSILTASVQGAVADTLNDQLRADFIVQGEGGGGPAALPRGIAGALADEPALAEVSPVALVRASDGDEIVSAIGADVTVIEELLALGVTEGDVTTLGADGIALLDEVADARGLDLGDPFELSFQDGTTVVFEVGARFASTELIGSGYLVSTEALDVHGQRGTPLLLLANAAGDLDEARAAVDGALTDAPGAAVSDQAEFREAQADAIDGILNLMIGLLLLAIVIALLGITNTLALAVIERTREIGLLRAVGMERGQTRRMVLWESVIVAAFGAFLGITVGTFLGWAVVQALADDGVTRLVLPGGQLAVYAVVAILAGVLAAAYPAWRASRLDVLRAVTVE